MFIDLLEKDGDYPNGNDIIIADCREGLKKFSSVKIQHCFREANKYADALARRGPLLSQDFIVFPQPPVDVALLISLDSTGTLYNRYTSCISVV